MSVSDSDMNALAPLFDKLAQAINDALKKNKPIDKSLEDIRRAGFRTFLILEATIAFEKIGVPLEAETSQGPQDPEAQESTPAPIELTKQDKKLLRGLRISLDFDH